MPYLDLRHAKCIGIDLDLTLIDTRSATASALAEVNRLCGESVDVDGIVERLGPPIRQELGKWVTANKIEEAVNVFREAFLRDGLKLVTPMPGAIELCNQLMSRDSRLIVITSRIPRIAGACLAHCGLTVSVVVGGVTGRDKAPAMMSQQTAVYVGDHQLDMEGAVDAGVMGVGVTTGSHSPSELMNAGARFVVPSLNEIVMALTVPVEASSPSAPGF